VIVLAIDNEGFFVDNVAVDPSRRGEGLGKALLKLAEAEARHAGFDSIHLYTHEKMTENLAIYSRLGYVGYDRRFRDKITLIFMTKRLG
jgi:ribosomal protein S18 acetylase RimI-like enzyme